MFSGVENRTFSHSGQGTRKANKTANSNRVHEGTATQETISKKTRTNKKQQNTLTEVCGFSSLFFFFFLSKKTKQNKTTHSTTLHYTMHMAWVGLTRLHLHLNPRSPARNPSLQGGPSEGVWGRGVRRGGGVGGDALG